MVGRIALLLIPAAIALAPVAHADEPGFVNDLLGYGFHVPGQYQNQIIKMGYAVCVSEASGTTHSEEVQEVFDTAPDGTINVHQAGNFVTAAEDQLCS